MESTVSVKKKVVVVVVLLVVVVVIVVVLNTIFSLKNIIVVEPVTGPPYFASTVWSLLSKLVIRSR